MDNRVFNVNGPLHNDYRREKEVEMLADTLKLAMQQHGENTKVVGWTQVPTHGLVLHWTEPEKLPEGLSFQKFLGAYGVDDTQALANAVAAWVDISGKYLPHPDGDHNLDHDGDNGDGWRVYCEGWGNVAGMWSAIVGVRHIYCWYGK